MDDDVIEGYIYNGKFYKETSHTTEIVSESGKIYIDLSTGKTYRWSGSTFVVISDTLALGETSSTAYRGDRGKVAYDHSQSAHAPSGAQANVIETVKVNGTALTPSSKAVNIAINGSNLKTSATKTASNTSSISNSIASGTALDTAIQTLLNNDKVLDTKSGEVNNKSIPTYDANTYYSYGNVVYYEGKVYRHIKVSSGGVPGVKGQVPTNTEYWKEITVSDLFKELSDAASILSSLTRNDFDYSGGPAMIGAPPYTVNESLKAIANVLRSLNSNLERNTFDINDEVIIHSDSIPYTFSDDGYIMLHTTTSAQIRINQYLALSSKSNDGLDFFNALNIRKGMKITELTGDGTIFYHPFKNE